MNRPGQTFRGFDFPFQTGFSAIGANCYETAADFAPGGMNDPSISVDAFFTSSARVPGGRKGFTMNMQRTEWMTGIGILNMALGAIGSLMSFFSMNNGGMPMIMGLLMIAACFAMMAGGMGVLK